MRIQKSAGISAILLMLTAAVCHQAVRCSILTAGKRCLTVLIPSLYFFSMLSVFAVRSDGLRALCGKKGLPLGILLFSQIGGYPVGAQLLHEAARSGEICKEDEKRLLCVCFGCGPGFLLGTVCSGLPLHLTLWVMLSVMLPNLLLAPLFLRGFQPKECKPPKLPFVQLLTGTAESAADAMLKITAMILAFAALMGLLEGLNLFTLLSEQTAQTIRSLLEVSCVTELLQVGGTLPTAAACLSFGGICVHLQLAAITGGMDWLRFLLTRLCTSAMTYLICFAGMKWLFCGVTSVFLPAVQPQWTTGSILPGACLLLMSVMLLRTGTRTSH
ncbi:MAG: hypothetical protein K6F80_04010 [Oscillospiraceae bacterium]|nr:hypothetical protein [Oscillospiraceae bacterium]